MKDTARVPTKFCSASASIVLPPSAATRAVVRSAAVISCPSSMSERATSTSTRLPLR